MEPKELIQECARWTKLLNNRLKKLTKVDLETQFRSQYAAGIFLNEFIQRREMLEFFSDRGYLDEAFHANLISKDEWDIAFCLVNTPLEQSNQKENHKALLTFLIQGKSRITAKTCFDGLIDLGLGLEAK